MVFTDGVQMKGPGVNKQIVISNLQQHGGVCTSMLPGKPVICSDPAACADGTRAVTVTQTRKCIENAAAPHKVDRPTSENDRIFNGRIKDVGHRAIFGFLQNTGIINRIYHGLLLSTPAQKVAVIHKNMTV